MLLIRLFLLGTLFYHHFRPVLTFNEVSCYMGEPYRIVDCYTAILTVPSKHLVQRKKYKFPAAFVYGTCVVLVERFRDGPETFALKESAIPPPWLWKQVNSGTYRIWMTVREMTGRITSQCRKSVQVKDALMAGPGTVVTQTKLLYALFDYTVTVRRAPASHTVWKDGDKAFVTMGLTEYYVYPAMNGSKRGTGEDHDTRPAEMMPLDHPNEAHRVEGLGTKFPDRFPRMGPIPSWWADFKPAREATDIMPLDHPHLGEHR